MRLKRVGSSEITVVRDLLRDADLTLSGLAAPSVRLWLALDDEGRAIGSTGYEMSDDGAHALIRSVSVSATRRSAGLGGRLARFALDQAASEGALRAWLFSRRSGPFWQRLGFEAADRLELAAVLSGTHQVELFRSTGQLDREAAWSRALP